MITFNSMGVKLINVKYLHLSLMNKNIGNGKNTKTIPNEDIDFRFINIKRSMLNKPNILNEEIGHCFNSYVDIEKRVLFLLM